MQGGTIAVIATGSEAERVRGFEHCIVIGSLAEAPAGIPVIAFGDPATSATDPRIAHVVAPGMPGALLLPLIEAIATGVCAEPIARVAETPAEARRAQRAFAASRRLAAATDLKAIEAFSVEAIQELLGADRAHCLFFSIGDGSIWSEALQLGPGDERRAIGGLVGWAAYTGRAVNVLRAGDDPRWLASIDDPVGSAGDAMIIQPVIGGDRQVHAVMVAVRAGRVSGFGEEEIETLARFATLAAPLLDQMSDHVSTQAVLDDDGAGQLFRAEAVAAAEPDRWGDVVRVSPTWLPWAYRILVVLLLASAAFITIGKVSTYSTGIAVVRSTARTSVTVHTAGNISSVTLQPGDKVERDAVIARLDDADQRATVDRINKEFETQLRNHMIDPNDTAADGSLRTLRLQLEQARAAFDDRAIRARSAGTLSDLRIRPGQHVEPGEIAASIVEGGGGLEVVALLPGEDRPQLSPGMQLRLELIGYRYAYQVLTIESVSSEVIAATEARRILGADVVGDLPIGGSVVVVRGKLASSEFDVDGQVYRYHDGMLGKAEVRLRSERILFAIVPGLRRLE